MTRTNKETIEVVTVSEQRRRRWSAAEKAALVRQTYEPGTSVSLVARQHGVAASQLFNWRKLERDTCHCQAIGHQADPYAGMQSAVQRDG